MEYNTTSIEKKKIPYKLSLGIICIRYNYDKNKFEFLMIKRRNSYAYIDFISKKYSIKDIRTIEKLFNKMTLEEKITISSRDFGFIYHKAHPGEMINDPFYFKRSNAFDNTFNRPNRNKNSLLYNLLENTSHVEIEYEFPKGRKNNIFEKDLDTALREFNEETNVPVEDISVIPNFTNKISFKSGGKIYKYKFYLAIPKKDIKPMLNINDITQLIEISDIRWFTMKEYQVYHKITNLNNNKHIHIMKSALKFAKNKQLINLF